MVGRVRVHEYAPTCVPNMRLQDKAAKCQVKYCLKAWQLFELLITFSGVDPLDRSLFAQNKF